MRDSPTLETATYKTVCWNWRGTQRARDAFETFPAKPGPVTTPHPHHSCTQRKMHVERVSRRRIRYGKGLNCIRNIMIARLRITRPTAALGNSEDCTWKQTIIMTVGTSTAKLALCPCLLSSSLSTSVHPRICSPAPISLAASLRQLHFHSSPA
jgi:hypothetical protein